MAKIILLAAVFTIMVSCKKSETKETAGTHTSHMPNKMAKAKWLIGSWVHTNPEDEMIENWRKVNDSLLYGERYQIVNKTDTYFADEIRLIPKKGNLAYIVTGGQYGRKPVRLDLTSSTESQLVFENPSHGFPNKVVYNKIMNDSLTVEISGTRNRKHAIELIAMKRQ